MMAAAQKQEAGHGMDKAAAAVEIGVAKPGDAAVAGAGADGAAAGLDRPPLDLVAEVVLDPAKLRAAGDMLIAAIAADVPTTPFDAAVGHAMLSGAIAVMWLRGTLDRVEDTVQILTAEQSHWPEQSVARCALGKIIEPMTAALERLLEIEGDMPDMFRARALLLRSSSDQPGGGMTW